MNSPPLKVMGKRQNFDSNHDTPHEFGVIGNHLSSSIVNSLGSIEWSCLPFLDSPSHFGAYLNGKQGGRFQIFPEGEYRSTLRYLDQSPILETVFESPTGKAILTDWMPAESTCENGTQICRKILMLDGHIIWNLSCSPRFKYGEEPAQAEKHSLGILFRGSRMEDICLLQSPIPIELSNQHSSASQQFSLSQGESIQFNWIWGRNLDSKYSELQATLEYWKKIAHRCSDVGCIFGGPWHEHCVRSGILLKLLSNSYSGAIAEGIVATLRELIPGHRVWDDRGASLRNGAWIIQALVSLGFVREAKKYFSWVASIIERDGVEGLQPIYTLDGGKIFPLERESFYSSKKLGARKFQLDIYGQIILTAYHYFQTFGELPQSIWPQLSEIGDYICQAWKRPDFGFSGTTVKAEHWVISKVYCWVALDRLCQLAQFTQKETSPRWKSEKQTLHKTICEQGFDSHKNSFIRSFGDRDLDATCLWIPLLGFLPYDDPRIHGTINAIGSELSSGVILRQTQQEDTSHFGGGIEFLNSFLYVACLALIGQIDEASDRLAELCTYSSSLGIFTEHPYAQSHYFPSAATHTALINAVLYVAWAKRKHKSPFHLLGTTVIPHLAKTA